jgi:hypothetical protein
MALYPLLDPLVMVTLDLEAGVPRGAGIKTGKRNQHLWDSGMKEKRWPRWGQSRQLAGYRRGQCWGTEPGEGLRWQLCSLGLGTAGPRAVRIPQPLKDIVCVGIMT